MRQPVREIQQRAPILLPPSLFYLPPQSPRDPMHPIANPQNRYAKCQHRLIASRRVRVIRGTRPTRQNQSRRLILPNIRNRGRAWQNRRKHLLLPHPPRNQLRILPPKIQHHHATTLRIGLPLFFHHLCPARHPLPSPAPHTALLKNAPTRTPPELLPASRRTSAPSASLRYLSLACLL